MKLSHRGMALIKSFEGCSLKAYQDDGGVWTLGCGHTGPDVVEGLTITQERADELFGQDIARFERGVTSLLKVPVTQNQFDALVSFSFNCGLDIDADTKAEGLGDSTLLRLVNEGNFAQAADEFKKWDHDGGRKVDGLSRRRVAEAFLFVTP